MAQLAFIEKVNLTGNSLKFLPVEIRNDNWPKIQKYLVSIQNRAAKWRERKLIFVGEEGTGKSTLIQCFLTKKNKTDCKKNVATDGIQIYNDISLQIGQLKETNTHSQDIIVSAWDFGGQQVFYPTHSFFLSSKSTYLVIFNMIQPDYSRLEYWLRTLKLLNTSKSTSFDNHQRKSSVLFPPSQIYIIGTHVDHEKCTEEYIIKIEEELKSKFKKNIHTNLQGIFFISSKTGQGISQLKEKLYANLSNIHFSVPNSWVKLSDLLKVKRENLSWTNWITFKKWANDLSIPDDELIDVATFLGDYGNIVFYKSKIKLLKSLIILRPQWLSDVMTCLISIKISNWIHSGILENSKIPLVFDRFPTKIHDSLLELLQHFQIIFPSSSLFRNNDQNQEISCNNYIIPSLLDKDPGENLSTYWNELIPFEYLEIGRLIRFPFLPVGFFDRFIAHMLQLKTIRIDYIWRNGMKIKLKSSKCDGLITFNENKYEVEIRVRYKKSSSKLELVDNGNYLPSSGLLLRIIIEVINTFTEGYNMEYDTERFIICPHCIKNQYKKPFLFTFIEIFQAIENHKLFVFCEYINSPSRCISIYEMAPDIAMVDMNEIDSSLLTIDKQIGRGGFGLIYSGELKNPSSDESIKVAIKEIVLEDVNSKTAVEEFYTEFQRESFIMSKLNHSNLIQFYGITKNPLRMIIELASFGDLLHFLHPDKIKTKFGSVRTGGQVSKEKFPWKLRLLMALDIAKGMKYLQEINPPITHRDLRSPNLFITSFSEDPNDVRIKIADFGLSRSSAIGLSGALSTWQWLAPEILEGTSYNELSDNYSYGICCWEIATRSFPFDEYGSNSEYLDPLTNIIAPHKIKPAIVNNHLRPSMPSEEEGAPKEFIEIIEKCLLKDPNERLKFPEIVKRLQQILHLKNDNAVENEFSKNFKIIKARRESLRFSQTKKSKSLRNENLRSLSQSESLAKQNSILPEFEIHFRENQEIINLSNLFPKYLISHIFIYLDLLYVGFENGRIFIYNFDGESKYKWKLMHVDHVSCIIHSNSSFWSIDKSLGISIWKNPFLLPKDHHNASTADLVNHLPKFKYSNQFNDIQMKIIESTTTTTIWVYTKPNYTESIRLYNLYGVLNYTISFSKSIECLIQYNTSVWIASKKSIYLYDASTFNFKFNWKAHENNITHLLPIKQNNTIWSSDSNGVINVWKQNFSDEIRLVNTLTLHLGFEIISLIFIAPNYVISFANDIVIIWNCDNGIPVQEIKLKNSYFNLIGCDQYFFVYNQYSVKRYSLISYTPPSPSVDSSCNFKKAVVSGDKKNPFFSKAYKSPTTRRLGSHKTDKHLLSKQRCKDIEEPSTTSSTATNKPLRPSFSHDARSNIKQPSTSIQKSSSFGSNDFTQDTVTPPPSPIRKREGRGSKQWTPSRPASNEPTVNILGRSNSEKDN